MPIDRHTAAPRTEHLTVLGESKLQLVPDAVEVSVDLSRIDDTPAGAKADIDDRSAKVIGLAKALGVEPRDIRATALALAPYREYQNQEYRHAGYQAARQVDVKLRDLRELNRLLTELVEVPVNRIIRIQTSLQDESTASQEALAKAIDDARGKAARIAQQLGVELGSVYSAVALPRAERLLVRGGAERGSGQDATFEPGTIDVEGRIEVTFYLAKPGPR